MMVTINQADEHGHRFIFFIPFLINYYTLGPAPLFNVSGTAPSKWLNGQDGSYCWSLRKSNATKSLSYFTLQTLKPTIEQ